MCGHFYDEKLFPPVKREDKIRHLCVFCILKKKEIETETLFLSRVCEYCQYPRDDFLRAKAKGKSEHIRSDFLLLHVRKKKRIFSAQERHVPPLWNSGVMSRRIFSLSTFAYGHAEKENKGLQPPS